MNDCKNLFICGFPGAGKSTLLKRLTVYGKGKEYHFLDLDYELILRSPYKSLEEWWQKKGEEHFRKKERELLLEWVVKPTPKIVALGGGTLDNPQNTTTVCENKGIIIYLEAPFDLCLKRIQHGPHRPLVKRGTKFLEKLYQKRCPLYRQASLLTLTSEKANNLREWGDFEEFLKDR